MLIKMLRTRLLLHAVMLIFPSLIFAQQKVTGTVKDKNGNPLKSSTVSEKGVSKNATKTNDAGSFSLTLQSASKTLVITNVGFKRQEASVGQSSVLEIVLAEDTSALTDVVIVGVQRQSKRTTTASVISVLGKDIENLPSPSVDQLLQGRVAGLNVQIGSGEPGVAPTIVVRGNSRVSTNISDENVAQAHALSGPLYVIDGVPTNPEDISNNIDATGTNYLAGININDIESIDVQKDAAATAAWGSRGANGVIYIRTKRGRSARPEFRVNVYGGITQRPQLLPTVTGSAERAQKMDLINQYATPAQLATLPQLLTDRFNPSFNNATDWQGLFYRQGNVKNVDATISAGTENVSYRVSMNYYDEKGIIQSFGFTRYSVRGNFDFKISPKLSSQFIVALSRNDRQRGLKFNGNSDDNTPVSGAAQPTSFYRLTAFDSSNFTGRYSKLRNKNINDLYNVSLTLNYTILPELRYTFQGAANISTSNRDYSQPSNIDAVSAANGGAAQPSYARSDKGTYSTYFLSNALNFSKRITTAAGHVHNFVLTGSQQFSADVSNTSYTGGYNVPSNNIQVVSGIPQSDLSGSSGYAAAALLSFAGQFQYDYNGRYLLYGSYRGDGSSRFGENTKWGYFPAAGAGWIVSDEGFMKSIKGAVNYLKLRGSYGISGLNSANFYAPYNSYIIPGTYSGGVAIQPSYINGLTKNNLTWTKTIQKNIGIETQLFNSRLSLTADVYDKLAKDDYYTFQLPFYTGFQSIEFNAHDLWVSNKGVDITLATRNLSRKSPLQWNTQLTISYNKNAIAKLPNGNRTFVVEDAYGASRIYAVGQPIYEMFQLKYLGVYNSQSEIPFNPITGNVITYFKGNHKVVPGDPIWLDVNKIGDVWPDENNGAQYGDRIPTGDPNPKFTGGFVNDLTYKNFSLSIISIFTWKRDVINTFFQQQISHVVGGYSSSIYTFANSRLPDLSKLNYWTPQRAKSDPNYKADFPSLNPFGPSYYQYIPISSQFNEDGSYFKVKNIVLSYQLPRKMINRAKLAGTRVYAIVDNIITFKNSTMPNPELVDQLGNYTGGLYPTPTKVTIGVDIQF
ncbi:MAG: SusC/RagA family TonB-linked outer membrane protein [Williamsia sp.]|nr:SusC/RagA family TonB-linked outer membrane protein [Williamsia sp.]